MNQPRVKVTSSRHDRTDEFPVTQINWQHGQISQLIINRSSFESMPSYEAFVNNYGTFVSTDGQSRASFL